MTDVLVPLVKSVTPANVLVILIAFILHMKLPSVLTLGLYVVCECRSVIGVDKEYEPNIIDRM